MPMTVAVEPPKSIDRVFRALSDPTRRRVLERLSRSPASVSELAKPFGMALPSFVQHMRILEGSGLVHSRKTGRVRTYQIVPKRLKLVISLQGLKCETTTPIDLIVRGPHGINFPNSDSQNTINCRPKVNQCPTIASDVQLSSHWLVVAPSRFDRGS